MRLPSKQIGGKKVVKFAASLLFVRSTRCVACDPVTSQDIYAFNTGMKQLNLKHLFQEKIKVYKQKGSSLISLPLCCSEYRFSRQHDDVSNIPSNS